jgi:glycine oxidase
MLRAGEACFGVCMQHVVMIGGGVMGCLGALELLEAGWSVTLLERQAAGRESSWAGGGIVSPLYPWRYPTSISALAEWSQGFYPTLAERLRDATGIDPEVNRCGLLWLDHAEQDQALGWAARQHKPIEAVTRDLIYRQVPDLAPGFGSGLWQADLANVRNPRLMAALLTHLRQHAGFRLIEHSPAQALIRDGKRVVGVEHPAGRVMADAVVLSAGAWSGPWMQEHGQQLPVAPVKGQMLLYRAEPGWLPSMVLHGGRYAIPRLDGHILIGSTLEHSGFDNQTTPAALASLQASAAALLPRLGEMQPVAQWSGLRPGSPEGVPYIGAVPDMPGLWVNAGHYRNGLVLAPASCRLLADLMSERVPEIDPQPYQPGRPQSGRPD